MIEATPLHPAFQTIEAVYEVRRSKPVGEWDLTIPMAVHPTAWSFSTHQIIDLIHHIQTAWWWTKPSAMNFYAVDTQHTHIISEGQTLSDILMDRFATHPQTKGCEITFDVLFHWRTVDGMPGDSWFKAAMEATIYANSDQAHCDVSLIIWPNLFTDVINLYKQLPANASRLFEAYSYPFHKAASINRSRLTEALQQCEKALHAPIDCWNTSILETGIMRYGIAEDAKLPF